MITVHTRGGISEVAHIDNSSITSLGRKSASFACETVQIQRCGFIPSHLLSFSLPLSSLSHTIFLQSGEKDDHPTDLSQNLTSNCRKREAVLPFQGQANPVASRERANCRSERSYRETDTQNSERIKGHLDTSDSLGNNHGLLAGGLR